MVDTLARGAHRRTQSETFFRLPDFDDDDFLIGSLHLSPPPIPTGRAGDAHWRSQASTPPLKGPLPTHHHHHLGMEKMGGKTCEKFSAGYFGLCAIGGLRSAGTTHVAITPLDVVKVNMQIGGGVKLYDPGYLNTAPVRSSICYIDGDAGILRYRGYPIEELAEGSSFLEVAYLLMYGNLPSQAQLADWEFAVSQHSAVPQGILDSYLEARCLAAAVEQFISCSACKMKRMSRTRASRGFGLYSLLPLHVKRVFGHKELNLDQHMTLEKSKAS